MSKIQDLLSGMQPGTVAHDYLPVGTMSSGMAIAIPVTVIKGRRRDLACGSMDRCMAMNSTA